MVDRLTQTPKAEKETDVFLLYINRNICVHACPELEYMHENQKNNRIQLTRRYWFWHALISAPLWDWQWKSCSEERPPPYRNTHPEITHKQSASQLKVRVYQGKYHEVVWFQIIQVLLCLCVQRSHRSSVAKRSIERVSVRVEKLLDICQTLDLKLLWFLLNHLPAQHNIWTHV